MVEAAHTTAALDVPPVDLTGLPKEQLEHWLATMLLIREFERACDPLAKRGKIPAGIHSSEAQEAVAVGTVGALQPGDLTAGSHRSHHHALAKGLQTGPLMAELYGRATGVCGGRGGTMHIADASVGFLGGNGIVGGGVGIALGAALAAKMRATGQVAVGFIGDGGLSIGRLWEFVNMAAIWQLPLIVICENNQYAVETPLTDVFGGESVARRAEGFGVVSKSIDGQDIGEVYRTVREAAERARSGEGATFVEAVTYRYEGHSTGQIITYRDDDEVELWRRRDPIARFNRALIDAGIITEQRSQELLDAALAQVAEAVTFAEESPWPEPESVMLNVFSPEVAERVQA